MAKQPTALMRVSAQVPARVRQGVHEAQYTASVVLQEARPGLRKKDVVYVRTAPACDEAGALVPGEVCWVDPPREMLGVRLEGTDLVLPMRYEDVERATRRRFRLGDRVDIQTGGGSASGIVIALQAHEDREWRYLVWQDVVPRAVYSDHVPSHAVTCAESRLTPRCEEQENDE